MELVNGMGPMKPLRSLAGSLLVVTMSGNVTVMMSHGSHDNSFGHDETL